MYFRKFENRHLVISKTVQIFCTVSQLSWWSTISFPKTKQNKRKESCLYTTTPSKDKGWKKMLFILFFSHGTVFHSFQRAESWHAQLWCSCMEAMEIFFKEECAGYIHWRILLRRGQFKRLVHDSTPPLHHLPALVSMENSG